MSGLLLFIGIVVPMVIAWGVLVVAFHEHVVEPWFERRLHKLNERDS